MRFTLNRRTALRGAGAVVALPLLEAMEVAACAAPPVRLMTYFWPNGPRCTRWAPSAPTLTPAALNACMQAFAPEAGKPDILPYLTVVTGLAADDVWKSGHSCAMMACGYGTADDHDNFGNWPTAATIDQLVGDRVAATAPTRAHSLVLSAPPHAYLDAPGQSSISWKDGGKIVIPERDPKAVWTRLFGDGASAAGATPDAALARALARRKSVLDFVKDDGKRLSAKLGAGDRARVDEHLSAIRDYETQYLQPRAAPAASGGACNAGAMPAGASDEAMLKLIVLAFRCDLTRVASFMLDVASGQRSYAGTPEGGDHDISHNGDDATKIARTNAKLKYLTNTLRDMASTAEGNGTLLDNVIVYANSDVVDGSHGRSPDPARGATGLPVVLAGRAGGALKSGRNVACTPGRPLSDLLCSILNYAGVPTPKYGSNGTGPIADL
jgi:hypothetical protein